jgi:uncharacterized protein DUF3455
MNDDYARHGHRPFRRPRIAGAIHLAAAWIFLLPALAHANPVVPPAVPAEIAVPAGNHAFFKGHAVGTQNYVCLPAGNGFAWMLQTPQATLFDDGNRPVTTHYFSPNPSESGVVRATWQHSRSTSVVWAKPSTPSSDAKFVAPGAVPWVLLRVVAGETGTAGGDELATATYVQRLNTTGGVAPGAGCTSLADVGGKAFVPYTADYYFYTDR